MAGYKKILVGCDGSGPSKNAFKQAMELAGRGQGVLEAVVVIPPPEVEVELVRMDVLHYVIKEPADKILMEVSEIAGAGEVSVTTKLERGQAYDRIVNVAAADGCDLIVTGRSGMRGLDKVLVGSVAARVIGYSTADVLVVPSDTAIGWEKIFLATDGSEHSEAALERALDFAESYGGGLTAISVVEFNEEFYAQAPALLEQIGKKSEGILEGVRKKAEDRGIEVETFIREGDAHARIVELARERKAGVIFMGSHGRSGLKRLLMGSVVERVIGYAPCPVFVIKT